ncbi:hypothetical protein ACK355_19015, partial [Aeromonas veronii]
EDGGDQITAPSVSSIQVASIWATTPNWIHRDHFTITHTNPAWFIPIVGNIVVPLGGMPLGFHEISLFFFSIGLIFWFSLLTIVLYRLFFHESLPEKLMPTMFILLAPPSIGFISYSEIASSSDLFAHVIYYFALFVFILLMYNTLTFLKLKFFSLRGRTHFHWRHFPQPRPCLPTQPGISFHIIWPK